MASLGLPVITVKPKPGSIQLCRAP